MTIIALEVFLNFEHDVKDFFNENDKKLIEIFAAQALIALKNAEFLRNLHHKNPSQLSILLNLVSTRINEPICDLDAALRLLLTGITAPSGLGFSRAMILLSDNDQSHLVGKMAIGPITQKEAIENWEKNKPSSKSLDDPLEIALKMAERFSESIKVGSALDNKLSLEIQKIRIPVKKSNGALLQCMKNQKSIVVQSSLDDSFGKLMESLCERSLNGYQFVCVPIGKTKTNGILVVDNRFLIDKKEIGENELTMLEAFASLMALKIDNAGLQRKLAEQQRLDTWKEFTGRIIHIMNSRLAVFEGSIERLSIALRKKDLDGAKSFINRLKQSVEKTQSVMNGLRKFNTPLELQKEEINLFDLISSIVEEFHTISGFEITYESVDKNLILRGDSERLSEAFIELINNAKNMFVKKPGCKIPIIKFSSFIQVNLDQKNICVSIRDNGPGIPSENKELIFDPYVSTSGTHKGLGLSIVKKIIESHHGTIKECGAAGMGAHFFIRFHSSIDP